MKVDVDYVKRLLEAFEACPDPIVSVRSLEKAGFERSPEFVFTLSHLNDLDLVKREDGKPGFGFARNADWSGSWSIVPLRITAQGSEFLASIRKNSVLATIKNDFNDEGIKTIVDLAKRLAEGYAKKKLDVLLGD